ncbi:MAG: molybdopterin molybdotransferase MoeA [Desulfobulbaceae bacterium]|nr:MAG: molybdopterin molybdotransferase MoeA [Desulfobulbaceae bacterium]
MSRHLTMGLNEALTLTLERLSPLEGETVPLFDSVDRVVAGPMPALVDSPSVDASLKDGYAVISREVAGATSEKPVRLKLLGSVAAGASAGAAVTAGTAIRVLTGARIPRGADAVVSGEFAIPGDNDVGITTFAEPGRNILPRGCDVTAGAIMAQPGTVLTPGLVGLLAAAGHSRVSVVRHPRVAIVATGDEVVAPGQPLPDGTLYASNMLTLAAWCRRYRMDTETAIVADEPHEMKKVFSHALTRADAIITSGGAWTGDRDMVARIMAELGWEQVFHRIRIGPGKAVGFGLLAGKPVFILPGGPPSNLMGFLQIALPGLLRLAGHRRPGLPQVSVRLSTELAAAHPDWTQFIFGRLEQQGEFPLFVPMKGNSRLGSLAEAEAVATIPEGRVRWPAGSIVAVQLLR